MPQPTERQRIIQAVTPEIRQWVDGFLVARKAEGKALGTLGFYAEKLAHFTDFCTARNVATVEAIDAGFIGEWLARGRTPIYGHQVLIRCKITNPLIL